MVARTAAPKRLGGGVGTACVDGAGPAAFPSTNRYRQRFSAQCQLQCRANGRLISSQIDAASQAGSNRSVASTLATVSPVNGTGAAIASRINRASAGPSIVLASSDKYRRESC